MGENTDFPCSGIVHTRKKSCAPAVRLYPWGTTCYLVFILEP